MRGYHVKSLQVLPKRETCQSQASTGSCSRNHSWNHLIGNDPAQKKRSWRSMNYNEKDELQGPQAPPRKKYLLQAGASKRDAMPGHTNHNGKRTVVLWVLMTPIRKTMGEECCCCSWETTYQRSAYLAVWAASSMSQIQPTFHYWSIANVCTHSANNGSWHKKKKLKEGLGEKSPNGFQKKHTSRL